MELFKKTIYIFIYIYIYVDIEFIWNYLKRLYMYIFMQTYNLFYQVQETGNNGYFQADNWMAGTAGERDLLFTSYPFLHWIFFFFF